MARSSSDLSVQSHVKSHPKLYGGKQEKALFNIATVTTYVFGSTTIKYTWTHSTSSLYILVFSDLVLVINNGFNGEKRGILFTPDLTVPRPYICLTS